MGSGMILFRFLCRISFLAGLWVFFFFGPVGCGDSGKEVEPDASLPDLVSLEPDPAFDEQFQGYGPEATVTTLVQVLRPRYDPSESFVDRYGRLRVPADELGREYPQPGEPHLARDELRAGGTVDATGRLSLLYFVQLADAQLADTQSPAYTPSNEAAIIMDLPAFHAAGPFFPHFLDAQVQTALQFAADRPFDFFVHVGDAA